MIKSKSNLFKNMKLDKSVVVLAQEIDSTQNIAYKEIF